MKVNQYLKHAFGRSFLTLVFGAVAIPAFAAGNVSLKSTVEIDVLVKQPDGSTHKQRQAFKSAPPGQEVIFTNTMTNVSKRSADHLVLNNPVPKNMRLVKVWGDNAKIECSIDGKNFAATDALKVKDSNGLMRQAVVADCTDVRWTVNLLKPSEATSVGFNAVVK